MMRIGFKSFSEKFRAAIVVVCAFGLLGLFIGQGCAEPLDLTEIDGQKDQGSQCNEKDRSGCTQDISIVSESPRRMQVVRGNPLQINVVAQGHQLTYQWYKNFEEIDGEDEASFYVETSADGHAGTYHLKITDGYGQYLITEVFNITVVERTNYSIPVILQQPADMTVNVGDLGGMIAITASGDPAPTYQWYKDGVAVAGRTTSVFKFDIYDFDDAGTYRVLVKNSVGEVWSDEAIITIPSCQINGRKILNTQAAVKSSLPGWGKERLVDGDVSTFYSSALSTLGNTTGEHITVFWNVPKTIKKIKLHPRYVGSTAYGFPATYRLYGATTQNHSASWHELGTRAFTTQPSGKSAVVFNFVDSDTTYHALLVNPDTIGTDDRGNYFYQMGEVEVFQVDTNCE